MKVLENDRIVNVSRGEAHRMIETGEGRRYHGEAGEPAEKPKKRKAKNRIMTTN